MSNFSIQERINQELDKISQAIQQLEMFLKQLTNQPGVKPRYAQNGTFVLRNVKYPCIY